jgi:hypothetical protein
MSAAAVNLDINNDGAINMTDVMILAVRLIQEG